MIIISQEEDRIINFEQVKFIEREKAVIFAYVGAEGKYSFICLGNYNTEERAKEVLNDIIKAIKGERFIEFDELKCNIHSISQNVFYMPKE